MSPDPLARPSEEEFRSQNRWLMVSAGLNVVLVVLLMVALLYGPLCQ